MELNLLDDDRITKIRDDYRNSNLRRVCILVTTGCLAILIILAATFTVFRLSDMSISADLEHNKNAISEKQGNELNRNLTTQRALDNMDDLHSKKQVFSLLLNFLQQLNIGVEYKNILITDDKKTTISGLANDFSMLDKLKNSFKNASVEFGLNDKKRVESLFASVEITEGVTESDKRVNFRIDLEYNPEVLEFGAKNVSLKKAVENE